MDWDNLLQSGDSKKPSPPTALVIFGTIVSTLGIGLTAISLPFIFPFFRRVCLPYVPATEQQITNVLKVLKGRTGTLIDLGSGDGRIVLATAANGFQSTGIELNPWLVCYSKLAAFRFGLYRKTKFLKYDLWKFNLKPYQNVVIFGVETMMEELENKFLKELQSDTWIVACRFPLTKLKPFQSVGVGVDTVWVYCIQKSI